MPLPINIECKNDDAQCVAQIQRIRKSEFEESEFTEIHVLAHSFETNFHTKLCNFCSMYIVQGEINKII